MDIAVHDSPRVAAGRVRGGRPSQQDALVCLHDAVADVRLLVVADGMGGDGAGELASDGVVATARRLWQERLWVEQPAPLFLETLCQQAHEELRRRRGRLVSGEPHSTIVALLLSGRRASWVHVGDSRLYRFLGKRCIERTLDHSLVELRVQRGEITPGQAASHVDQNKLLRGLGGDSAPMVEHGGAMLGAGECFVLCSDGVWAHLSDSELGACVASDDLDQALRQALALALERGGKEGDNAALVLVRAQPVSRFRRYAAGLVGHVFKRHAARRMTHEFVACNMKASTRIA